MFALSYSEAYVTWKHRYKIAIKLTMRYKLKYQHELVMELHNMGYATKYKQYQ